jgi:hypothetical protein
VGREASKTGSQPLTGLPGSLGICGIRSPLVGISDRKLLYFGNMIGWIAERTDWPVENLWVAMLAIWTKMVDWTCGDCAALLR